MRIVAIASGILVLFAAAMTYNIWHASNDPVTSTPGPLETGRTKLHQQLEEAKKTEAQVEKEAWDSAPALRGLIKGHEQRTEKLKGNAEAAEILAYDQDSIQRLKQRIAEILAQQAAKAENESLAVPSPDSPTNPAVSSKTNSAANSKREPPTGSKPRPAIETNPKPPQNSQP
jgi:hypothetical protein